MAPISIFDIFKIGIGPSSSHTVGPMKAAKTFADAVADQSVEQFHVTLFGSLAWTGKGHGTDTAVLLGLYGHEPETLDPDAVDDILARIRDEGRVEIDFNYDRELERHTNGMTFAAIDASGGGGEAKVETIRRRGKTVRRHDPCPCGSGKKYKNCCMRTHSTIT